MLLHTCTKFQGKMIEFWKQFKFFHHKLAWWPAWACDHDHLYNLLSPFSYKTTGNTALIGNVVSDIENAELQWIMVQLS